MHKSPDFRPRRLLAMMPLIVGCATTATPSTPTENALERARLERQCQDTRSEIATRRATVRAYLGLGMGLGMNDSGRADCEGVQGELDVIVDLLAQDRTSECARAEHMTPYATVQEMLLGPNGRRDIVDAIDVYCPEIMDSGLLDRPGNP